MKSSALGKSTSRAEVQDITRHGVWLLVRGREYFLGFKEFPWFKDAKVSGIYNVTLQHRSHLYWPDLDVDLHVDSLSSPEKFPLLAKQ